MIVPFSMHISHTSQLKIVYPVQALVFDINIFRTIDKNPYIPGGIGLNRAGCDNFFSLIFSVRLIVTFFKNHRKQNFQQLELLICINSKWPPHWNRILALAPKPFEIID